MFLEFDGHMANDKFVSVMVMSYFRPEMTLELLKSIHRHADMPFEIILHDDHSDSWVQDKIYKEMKNLCSTIILGQGDVNLGFASAANRGTALCNSDYVLLLNNDCLMVNPCFQMIKDVLDTPYVASVGPRDVASEAPGAVHARRAVAYRNGRAFTLSNLPDGSGVFAYRKQVWFEHGGFPQVYSNGGDIAFIFSLIKEGYFHAGSIISPGGEGFCNFRNVDQENEYKDATAGIRHFDQAYPRIFPYCNQGDAFHMECHRRRERRHPLSHEQYLVEAGYHNISYWDTWGNKSYDKNGGIDWDNIEDWGHVKWREEVDKDINAWKALAG